MVPALERGDPQARQAALGEAQHVALAAQLEVASRPARTRRWSPSTALRRAWAVSSVESETSTQNDSAVPRPTRPRSWWSWARPNRSAPSMIIIVASGTSTPTSTTVVPTRTSRLAVAEAGHLGVAVGRLHPAVDQPDPERREELAQPDGLRSRPRPARTVARRRRRPPRSMRARRRTSGGRRRPPRGPCCPRPVELGPGAGSRSGSGSGPPAASAGRRRRGRRRGPGRASAGSASRSSAGRAARGPPAFASSWPRCSTPKRCCSSMTTRPRSRERDRAPGSGRGSRRRPAPGRDCDAPRAPCAVPAAVSEPVRSSTGDARAARGGRRA